MIIICNRSTLGISFHYSGKEGARKNVKEVVEQGWMEFANKDTGLQLH